MTHDCSGDYRQLRCLPGGQNEEPALEGRSALGNRRWRFGKRLAIIRSVGSPGSEITYADALNRVTIINNETAAHRSESFGCGVCRTGVCRTIDKAGENT
jgi:hypothetical protein